jgi:hypothetical protein
MQILKKITDIFSKSSSALDFDNHDFKKHGLPIPKLMGSILQTARDSIGDAHVLSFTAPGLVEAMNSGLKGMMFLIPSAQVWIGTNKSKKIETEPVYMIRFDIRILPVDQNYATNGKALKDMLGDTISSHYFPNLILADSEDYNALATNLLPKYTTPVGELIFEVIPPCKICEVVKVSQRTWVIPGDLAFKPIQDLEVHREMLLAACGPLGHPLYNSK